MVTRRRLVKIAAPWGERATDEEAEVVFGSLSQWIKLRYERGAHCREARPKKIVGRLDHRMTAWGHERPRRPRPHVHSFPVRLQNGREFKDHGMSQMGQFC